MESGTEKGMEEERHMRGDKFRKSRREAANDAEGSI